LLEDGRRDGTRTGLSLDAECEVDAAAQRKQYPSLSIPQHAAALIGIIARQVVVANFDGSYVLTSLNLLGNQIGDLA
jgi:hypothetical protein